MMTVHDRVSVLANTCIALNDATENYRLTGGVNRELVAFLLKSFPNMKPKGFPPLAFFTVSLTRTERESVEGYINAVKSTLTALWVKEFREMIYLPDIKTVVKNYNPTVADTHLATLIETHGNGETIMDKDAVFLNTLIKNNDENLFLLSISEFINRSDNRLLKAYLAGGQSTDLIDTVINKLPGWLEVSVNNIDRLLNFINSELALAKGKLYSKEDYNELSIRKMAFKALVDRLPEREFNQDDGMTFVDRCDKFCSDLIAYREIPPLTDGLTVRLYDIYHKDLTLDIGRLQRSLKDLRTLDKKLIETLTNLANMDDALSDFNDLMLIVKDQIVGINRLCQIEPVLTNLVASLKIAKIKVRDQLMINRELGI